MAKYQLLQIKNREETVLVDSDKKRDVRKRYYRDGLFRIRVDGKILRIFEADAWAAGKRIPKPAQDPNSPEKVKRVGNGERAVALIDAEGNVLKQYKTLKDAAKESGYKTCGSVKAACDSGQPTSNGKRYRWAV